MAAEGPKLVDPAFIGVAMRSARLLQDLTLEWVADRVGVTKQAISDFETDTTGRKRPTEETLRKWLTALNMPQEWADQVVEYRIEEDLDRAMAALNPPPAPEQRAMVRMNLRNALRTRR